MSKFFWRVTGAAVLNPAVYEDVEADASATIQASIIVLLSSLAAGIGAMASDEMRVVSLVIVSALALGIWVLWALLTLELGGRIFPTTDTHVTPGELLRTIGFATTPGLFRVAAVLAPHARAAIFAVTAVWMLAAMIVAVRQALDYKTTTRAIAICGLAWALSTGLAVGIGIVFGPSLY